MYSIICHALTDRSLLKLKWNEEAILRECSACGIIEVTNQAAESIIWISISFYLQHIYHYEHKKLTVLHDLFISKIRAAEMRCYVELLGTHYMITFNFKSELNKSTKHRSSQMIEWFK